MAIAVILIRERLRGSVVEPEDLVQGAIAKTLGGDRKWNLKVDIIKHLAGVMESDSGHEAKKRAIRALRPLPDDDLTEPVDPQPLPEAALTARDELKSLLGIFVDDQGALDLLHWKGNGLSASEIRGELGIGSTQYDTVTKRIRRRLAKHITKGGQ